MYLIVQRVSCSNTPPHSELSIKNAFFHQELSPPQRLPLGIPEKIVIIEKNRKRAGKIFPFLSCPARSLSFSPASPLGTRLIYLVLQAPNSQANPSPYFRYCQLLIRCITKVAYLFIYLFIYLQTSAHQQPKRLNRSVVF